MDFLLYFIQYTILYNNYPPIILELEDFKNSIYGDTIIIFLSLILMVEVKVKIENFCLDSMKGWLCCLGIPEGEARECWPS